MALKNDIDDISREEDFRDFDERNIDQGWPYADTPGESSGAVDNAEYGAPERVGGGVQNLGFLIENAGADGMEERVGDSVRPGTAGLEEADDLEERLTDALDMLGDVDMDLIDVRAEGTTVTVEGQADSTETARRILGTVRNVTGVGKVINHLRLAGVDSRIPDDD